MIVEDSGELDKESKARPKDEISPALRGEGMFSLLVHKITHVARGCD